RNGVTKPSDNREDDHGAERLKDGPGDPQHGLFVADLDIPQGQDPKEFAELPQISYVDRLPAVPRRHSPDGVGGEVGDLFGDGFVVARGQWARIAHWRPAAPPDCPTAITRCVGPSMGLGVGSLRPTRVRCSTSNAASMPTTRRSLPPSRGTQPRSGKLNAV